MIARPLRWLVPWLAVLSAGCSGEPARGPLVLAASSLQGPLDTAADAWAADGHARPVLSYAGTPALARQLEAGAPADLFVSADAEWMDELSARGLVRAGSRAVLARNELVVVVSPFETTLPAGIMGGVTGNPADVLTSGAYRVAIADPESVPAGRYAKAALIKLKLWRAVSPRLVPTENVRAALALVERGATTLGIVYATDAGVSGQASVIATFPADSVPPILYPIALTTASSSAEAEGFRRFLLGPQGQAILRRAGFRSP